MNSAARLRAFSAVIRSQLRMIEADRSLDRRQRLQGRLVTAFASSVLQRLATLATAVFLCVLAGSCGRGGVADNSSTGSTAIAISPSTATLFSDLPTTFVLSGGNGSYVVTSSNQAVIGFTGVVTGRTLTVIPSAVAADTPVTLTVTDTANHAPAAAALTVKPRTINNAVTITPSASQSAECGTSVCSGGDAEVRVTLTQNGVPLTGRTVRFDVVSGDVRIITSPAGLPETLGTSGTTTTDSSGTARMRVRVLADAPAQTALIQVTDLSTGFVQTASIAIAPSSNAPLTVRPTAIQFTGPNSTTCSSGVSADIVIIGGRPPYQVTQPPGFAVSPSIVTNSGGRVTVRSTGQCALTSAGGNDGGQTIAIIDNNGATASVLVHNDPAPSTVQPSPFVAAPLAVTLASCQDVANIALAGGSGSYFAASGNSALFAGVVTTGSSFSSGTQGVIYRQRGTPPGTQKPPASIPVSFSDGQTVQTVTVSLTGEAADPCPP